MYHFRVKKNALFSRIIASRCSFEVVETDTGKWQIRAILFYPFKMGHSVATICVKNKILITMSVKTSAKKGGKKNVIQKRDMLRA